MSAAGLVPGAIFAERYRVVRCIAQGGMGAVYEVVHLETERRRALKVMLPHVLQSAELRQRFQLEAKIAANVESDFIVDVFDAGYDEPTQMPFLVMELLRGEEVSKRLKRLGRLPASEVVAILHQTALALDKTHRASIVHRDLKPENLFLTEREDGPPRVKVLDFGIAKVVAESATSNGLTQSIGTPLFMAPEQFNPRAVLSGAADLYALAMVAYKLLVGQSYWAEEAKSGNVFALAAVAIHGPKDAASARAAEAGVPLSPAFDIWFARAAALEPGRRFASGREMVVALAQALDVASSSRAPLGSLNLGETGGSYSAPFPAATTPPSGIGGPAEGGSAPGPSGLRTPGTVAVVAASGSLAVDLPDLTCPAPDATSTSAPSFPSVPTHIAAPATAGTTPPPAASPSRGVVIAVAVGAACVLGLGGWLAARASAGSAAEHHVAASPVATAASPPSAIAVDDVATRAVAAGPVVAPGADPVLPATSVAASAEPPVVGKPPVADPPVSRPAASAPPPAAPPALKKRKYTRE